MSALRASTLLRTTGRNLAASSRPFTTSGPLARTVTETVKDAAATVDRVAADAALKGIETGEKVTDATANATRSATGTAQEYTGSAKGTAQEYTGLAKGTAQEYTGSAKGTAQEYTGKAKGAAEQAKGKAKGIAEQAGAL